MSTLHGPYYEKMIGSISSNFSDLITIGERVEEGIKSGKIQGTSNARAGEKKSSDYNPKEEEGEANAVVIGLSQPPHQMHHVLSPQQQLVIPQQNHQQQAGYQQRNQPGPKCDRKRRNMHYDRLPMPYGQILPYLVQKGMVELKPLHPVEPPYPLNIDVNAKCDYHAGAPGHDIENCKGFKHK
ncbi:gag-pol polyprotein, partial [Trifolium medium]|nr:gag-pol polyprotein [Trifolium medium]